MFIDGKFVESKTNEWIDLHDPATNKLVTRVPKCTQDEMLQAVESSKAAYKVRIDKTRESRGDGHSRTHFDFVLFTDMETNIDSDQATGYVQVAAHY
jgi:hypothetical protein